jgi:hypothetical protein
VREPEPAECADAERSGSLPRTDEHVAERLGEAHGFAVLTIRDIPDTRSAAAHRAMSGGNPAMGETLTARGRFRPHVANLEIFGSHEVEPPPAGCDDEPMHQLAVLPDREFGKV